MKGNPEIPLPITWQTCDHWTNTDIPPSMSSLCAETVELRSVGELQGSLGAVDNRNADAYQYSWEPNSSALTWGDAAAYHALSLLEVFVMISQKTKPNQNFLLAPMYIIFMHNCSGKQWYSPLSLKLQWNKTQMWGGDCTHSCLVCNSHDWHD